VALKDDLVHAVRSGISAFGADVTATARSVHATGDEYPLREPFATLMQSLSEAAGLSIVAVPEAKTDEGRVRPDYAVEVDGALAGFVELKGPSVVLQPSTWPEGAHNRTQWETLRRFSNLIYCNGNEWVRYSYGAEQERHLLDGDVRRSGSMLAPRGDRLAGLIATFLSWSPPTPKTAEELAGTAANMARILEDEVADALAAEAALGGVGPFTQLADDCRDSLFPGATDEQIADWYAQTVTFSLLLARAEGDPLDNRPITAIADDLSARHGLLGRALRILAEPAALAEVRTSVQALVRHIAPVDWDLLSRGQLTLFPAPTAHIAALDSPWLNFYELFLKNYDPKLREKAGAYYTPPEVVTGMTQLTEAALRTHLGMGSGFADTRVITLDPAMGSGSFLVSVIDRAAGVAAPGGQGAIAATITDLSQRLLGFELMAGPYAVAETLVTGAMKHYGAALAPGTPKLYLTNTLDDPDSTGHILGSLYLPITESRRWANEVKKTTPVVVVIGNPPYDFSGSGAALGGWVRNGPDGQSRGIHADWIPDATEVSAGDLHRQGLLDDLYVYFWRWAAWKVFEQDLDKHGIVTFISNSSFLAGGVFARMRRYLREQADFIYVADLGGDSRYGRSDPNVFPIRIPVTIVMAVRKGTAKTTTPAQVRYLKVAGSTQTRKRRAAADLGSLRAFEKVDRGWLDPLIPPPPEAWKIHPPLTDLLPFQPQAIDTKRDWVIAPSAAVLNDRWRALALTRPMDRNLVMNAGQGRDAAYSALPLRGLAGQPGGVIGATVLGPPGPAVLVSWRTLDQQVILADDRIISRPSPLLWACHGPAQVYLTTMHERGPGSGAAVTAAAHLPISGHFNGNGAGDMLPLWLDPEATLPNLLPGLLDHLTEVLERPVSPLGLVAYIAGVTAHPGYTRDFQSELTEGAIRVPITTQPDLFETASQLGARVIWAHTLGQRFIDPAQGRPDSGPVGTAQVTVPIPARPLFYEATWHASSKEIHLGDGRVGPVPKEVWNYQVAPWKVLQRWLSYRQGKPARRRPRDDPQASILIGIGPQEWEPAWTNELLRVIWAIETLLSSEPHQAAVLSDIMAHGTFVTVEDLTVSGVLPVPALASRLPGEGGVLSERRRRPRLRGS
jgi:hypothetical protein